MENIFKKNWELCLESQFLCDNHCRRRAYICSPLSAEKDEDFIQNMRTARAYMYYASEKMNFYARAPHAYLPMLLCDELPAERALALRFGLSLLEQSDVILVCGSRISNGMRGEITHAASLNMPIITFEEGVYLEVQKLVTQHGGSKSIVKLDRENFMMSFLAPESYYETVAVWK